MVVDTKLYDLLGVSPDADERTLKKAFMKKARELHPDKNRDDPKATEKFQAVNEAYEVLKDPEKRANYDRFGPDSLHGDGGPESDFQNDIFSHIFGSFGSFGDFGFGGGRRSSRPRRTQDISYELSVPLEELYTGGDRKLPIQRERKCTKCNGNGTADGRAPKKCPKCNGTGQIQKTYTRGHTQFCQVGMCSQCGGTGEFVDNKESCSVCHGRKTVIERKTITIHVTPGMEDGEVVTIVGESNEEPGCETGDLNVIIREQKHPVFKRNHENLKFTKNLTFVESILGYKFTVTTLDGRTLIIEQHDKITVAGDVIKIAGEGMPLDNTGLKKGDLFIEFHILPMKKSDIPQPVIEALQLYMPPSNPDVDESDPNVFRPKVDQSNNDQYRRFQKKKKQERRREAYNSDNEYSDDDGQRQSCQPM